MVGSTDFQNPLTRDQIAQLTRLETQLRALYKDRVYTASRLSLAYHPSRDNHPEHIVIRMGNKSACRQHCVAMKSEPDALPELVLEDMTAALREDGRVGKKGNYVAIDGSFEDAAEILENAMKEISEFREAQRPQHPTRPNHQAKGAQRKPTGAGHFRF